MEGRLVLPFAFAVAREESVDARLEKDDAALALGRLIFETLPVGLFSDDPLGFLLGTGSTGSP